MEFYTQGQLSSGDFDFVSADQHAFEDALQAAGFTRPSGKGVLQRGFIHPELALGVEVVGGALLDGRADTSRIRIVDIDRGSLRFTPVEDLIADRMAQWLSTPAKVPEMLQQAILLFRLADDLDETYLDRRISAETGGEATLAILKARSDDTD